MFESNCSGSVPRPVSVLGLSWVGSGRGSCGDEWVEYGLVEGGWVGWVRWVIIGAIESVGAIGDQVRLRGRGRFVNARFAVVLYGYVLYICLSCMYVCSFIVYDLTL